MCCITILLDYDLYFAVSDTGETSLLNYSSLSQTADEIKPSKRVDWPY